MQPGTEFEGRVRAALREMHDELPGPLGPDVGLVARARRAAVTTLVAGILACFVFVGVALAVIGHTGGTRPANRPHPASDPGGCHRVVPACHVPRLADLTLHGNQRSGALHSVDGFDLGGIISFDDALRRAAQEDGIHNDARSMRVILGSADADKLHWGHGKRLFYVIDWTGICMQGVGPFPGPSPSPTPRCPITNWGTVIDARTGAFIVGGTA